MNTHTYIRILALQCAVLLMVALPLLAYGDESSSFKLYTGPETSDQSPLDSTSFTLNENGESWTAFPLTGSNFQIVTVPPATVVSSSSSSSTSSSESADGGGSGSGGGRGSGPRSATPSEPQPEPEPELEPDELPAAPEEGQPQLPASVVPGAGPSTEKGHADAGAPVAGTVEVPGVEECTGNACICECPALQDDTHCSAPERFVQVPVPVPVPTVFQSAAPSVMLLIAAYLLGYTSKYVRTGSAKLPETIARKPRKKHSSKKS